MATKATNSAEELTQAYNQTISGSFAAINAGMTQAAATAKLFTDAVQAERDEYGKAVGQVVNHARARSENLVGVMQGMATMPASGVPSFPPEVKESVGKLIEGEMAFYQTWTKGWIDYWTGVEARRSTAAQVMLEGNVKLVESSQEAMKSAAKYGEAFMDWSLEAVNGMKK